MSKAEILKGSNAKMINGHNAMKIRLNITKLREVLKNRPDLKQSYDAKDGKNEFIDIEVWESKPEYQSKFSTHYLQVAEAYKPDQVKTNNVTANDFLPKEADLPF